MFSPRRYCRYRIYLGCVLFYSSFWIHSLSIHLHVHHVGFLLCPLSFPGALFLSFVLFWLRRCGVGFPWEISIVIGAWTIFVRTCCLATFRIFPLFWWLIAYRILFSRIVCDIAVLLVLVVAVSRLAFWRNNSCNPFYRWFSWGKTIVWPRLMPSFFIKFPAGQCLMMYDDRYWYMETHVSCIPVTGNLKIKQNKNLSKNWILSILQS